MPTSIKLDDRLAAKVAVLATEAGLPIDTFVERMLQALVDADIELRDGIPVFRMPLSLSKSRSGHSSSPEVGASRAAST